MTTPVALSEPWMQHANCRGIDPDLFFPVRGDTAGVKACRQICACCVVRARCLDYSFEHFIRDGVWGGLTARERRVELARRRAAA